MPSPKVLIRAPRERERRAAAGMTGRYIMTFQHGAHDAVDAVLSAHFSPARRLAADSAEVRPLDNGGYILLPHIGIAIVDPGPEQEDALHKAAETEDSIMALEPERMVHAVAAEVGPTPLATAPADVSWGLQATGVAASPWSGQGVKIAILDSGLDLTHPDFAGRQITTQNFVGDGSAFHDGLGHGTHCTGTAAGPLKPGAGPRYGVAYQALIHAGRVLDDTGSGGDANVLQGIDWAVGLGCAVISMSFEGPWTPGDPPYNQAYETAAQRALAAGCLVVAAAGNEAGNPSYVGAVGPPGNSPSVLTVAAVDQSLATASFSNRAEPSAAGVKGPDLAAPGVDIYSAWLVARGSYRTISGTSMAAPQVAGVAALWAEAHPTARGQTLRDLILASCADPSDGAARRGEIGHGLVRAPT